jgi:glycosyltransferase involved in cell wall biosynthesis
MHWHVLTGEYPPQPGGVSDYTRLVARGLAAAGDTVTVFAPPLAEDAKGDDHDRGVDVQRLPDHYGRRALQLIDRRLERTPGERRILVQYVPHAFGWRAMNVPFCWWLHARRRQSIWVMFHEVVFPLERSQSLTHNALAVVTRGMASLVAGAAERAFVSIPAWHGHVESRMRASARVDWLPVPSAIPVVNDARGTAEVRTRFAQGRPLVGHFGTYGALTRPLLERALASLPPSCDCRVLLLGSGSREVASAIEDAIPRWRQRLDGTGALPAVDVSRHLAACDLMLQPYPDGVSARRTSVMAALAHGKPVVTTDGALTEPIWREAGAVSLRPAADPAALGGEVARIATDPAGAAQLASRGLSLYESRFALRHTIAALTGSGRDAAPLRAVS